jgi:hypothetical protein
VLQGAICGHVTDMAAEGTQFQLNRIV